MEDGGGRQEQADMQAEEAGRGRRPACLHTQPEREAEVSRAGGEREEEGQDRLQHNPR